MLENFDEENDFVEFFDIQNLYFDHPLSFEEYDELKEVILGFNNLSQVYFKGTCDLKSILKVKDLLLMSNTVVDSNIEKIITCNLNDTDYDTFINGNFKNPETWSISYYEDGNNYMIDTVPNVREFHSYIERIKMLVRKENLTPLETVLRIYDIVKLFEYDEKCTDNSLSTIVKTNKCNNDGFNKLFSFILNKLNIPNYVGSIKNSDGEENLITMIMIEDPKYNINGVFLFNPAFDSLDKKNYKDDLRMINYNYFGLKLEDIDYSKYDEYLTGTLGILAINNYDYAIDRLSHKKDINLNKEFNKMFTTFNTNIKFIYDYAHNNCYIDEEVISELCSNVYEDTIMDNFSDIVKNNYLERKKELFNDNIHEEFNKMLDKKS
jgi:hypothetical protein